MKCPICNKLFSEIKFHFTEHSKEDIINELVNLMLSEQTEKSRKLWEWEQLKRRLERDGYFL